MLGDGIDDEKKAASTVSAEVQSLRMSPSIIVSGDEKAKLRPFNA